jgi:hypothetical protein
VGQTEGIDARDMDRSRFAIAYMKMVDGSYIFGKKSNGEDQIHEYSPLIYCTNKKNDADPDVVNVCHALMQYGAAAQYAQYNQDGRPLMNEGFEERPYAESVLGESVYSATGAVTNGMKLREVTMDLKGAISYIVKVSVEDANIADKKLYAEYTLNGETVNIELEPGWTDNYQWAVVRGVAPKDLDETLRIKPYYVDENGEKVYGAELVYSAYEYVRRMLPSEKYYEYDKDLARALAMYIHYADIYAKNH